MPALFTLWVQHGVAEQAVWRASREATGRQTNPYCVLFGEALRSRTISPARWQRRCNSPTGIVFLAAELVAMPTTKEAPV
jgi:hypothetical protein